MSALAWFESTALIVPIAKTGVRIHFVNDTMTLGLRFFLGKMCEQLGSGRYGTDHSHQREQSHVANAMPADIAPITSAADREENRPETGPITDKSVGQIAWGKRSH